MSLAWVKANVFGLQYRKLTTRLNKGSGLGRVEWPHYRWVLGEPVEKHHTGRQNIGWMAPPEKMTPTY